jgi:hypothetical protein
MTAQSNLFATQLAKHPGPPLWLLAILYTVLFIAGLTPVTAMGGLPYCPSLLFLVPLVRFPGFIWIIAVGFAMPRSRRALAETQAA